MTTILIVGSDTALLEGVSQTLVGAGHQVVVGRDIREGLDSLRGARPLVVVVHRDELVNAGAGFRSALAHGGAIIAFNSDETEEMSLPFALKRATLAELHLPLERQRLLALIRNVESRARAAGRDADDDTPMEAHSG